MAAAENDDKGETIQSVAMALSILENLAFAQDDVGVTELSGALKTTKSRIHRHLRTLLNLGYIMQSPKTERYRIGIRLIELGKAAAESTDLSGIAQTYMRQLRDETGHAVIIGQVDDDGIRILNKLSGKLAIDVGVRPGSVLGYVTSAQGKVALAAMAPTVAKTILQKPLEQVTEYTITDRKTLISHIEDIRKRGWATAPNEGMLGLNALACPIFSAGGELAGTIAIVGLTQYIQTPPDPKQIDAVMRAAEAISDALGYDPESRSRNPHS